jgi:predicted phosphodiesterase
MKILAVADHEAKYFYDYYTPGRLAEYDLIIACGDLKRSYLEFLVTMARCPLLYVHGNHDDRLDKEPPEGCICIEDQIYVYKGVRILGLGGSYRYRKDGKHMYTERQMANRILLLKLQLWKHKGFDILVTHAPAYRINDMNTMSHRGFQCFVDLLDHYAPKYFIHGHVHRNYGPNIPRKSLRGDTIIINADEYYRIDYDETTSAPQVEEALPEVKIPEAVERPEQPEQQKQNPKRKMAQLGLRKRSGTAKDKPKNETKNAHRS